MCGKRVSASSGDALILPKDDENTKDVLHRRPTFGTRHALVTWAFLGFAVMYILRVNMTITLVAMTTNSSGMNLNLPNSSDCIYASTAESSNRNYTAEFDWSNTVQGFVLSAFYYGYFASQIPASFLVRCFGGRTVLGISLMICSALSLLTPEAARFSVWALICVRALQGCSQGLVFPSMQLLLSKWAPSAERSQMVAFTYSGCQAGTVVGILVAGILCSTNSLGWPSVFYIFGGAGILWALGWLLFAHETPAHHPRITDSERYFIESTVGRHPYQLQTPWRAILTSPALYAIMGAHFANDWGCFALMTCLPKFMKEVLNFDINENGILSSLPYLVMWIVNFVAGPLADHLRKPNRLSTAVVRKLMVSVGLFGPAVALLVTTYLPGCQRTLTVSLLTLAMGFSGFTIAGHSVNHLDIAPAFAAVLFALTNTVGTISGLIGPALVGVLTEKHETRSQWNIFFIVSGSIYSIGGLIFVLLARGELQDWAKMKDLEASVSVLPSEYGSIQKG
ncbi:hypothetical protein C0Q70_07921 [Pomacea canaliculata]|uniref:Major facilitator superfamily (MFS) profile domain-containing protein n=1 Tax=Pomacea canaliculata TaxID=400727 RepID=A0A2T7PGD3_POMCA|nr:hypothetical protein C0Q70_07921 [Pomacea canaliculata]